MVPSTSVRTVVLLVGIALLAPLLSGCGRRGQLEPPPDPSAQAPPQAGELASPIGRRPKHVPIEVPHEPFILDPLL